MHSRRIVAIGIAVAAALFVGCAGSGAESSGPSSSRATQPATTTTTRFDPRAQRPDLDQELPSELDVRLDKSRAKPSYRLGFRSAVRNIGAGPLIIEGKRANRTVSTMTVDQIIERDGLSPVVVANVGRMQYAVSPDHSHWHYLEFDRYVLQRAELRAVDGDAVIVADRKTGFCLGDRYPVADRRVPDAPLQPVFTSRCGLSKPELLEMREGISVGYGDDYDAFLEGQDLPLDGLPAGRYVLVHRVNSDLGLQEISHANNAASVLIELRWIRDVPNVRVLASCPDTDRCAAK